MRKISYKGYRFPAEIIQRAIWLYLRFTLSFRDVEDLLAERGITVSYETVRRWVNLSGDDCSRPAETPPQASHHVASRRRCAAKAPAVMWVPSCKEDEGRPLEADRQG